MARRYLGSMADPVHVLQRRLEDAIVAALGPEVRGTDPLLRRAGQVRFGDYQANAPLSLAKRLGRPGPEVAAAIVKTLDVEDICSKVDVGGGGFINMTLDDRFIADQVGLALSGLGIEPASPLHRFVLDYAGPNVAKEMHVGHLRSAVIGDALARMLEFLDHVVIRQDHLGDWGRQFGMLVEHLVDLGWSAASPQDTGRSVADLNELYRAAQQKFDSDSGFAERARRRVVLLQSGDGESTELWHQLVEESERHFLAVYRRLGLTLGPEDTRPESFYQPMLDPMVAELEEKGLVRVDDGALCAFPPGFTGRDGGPLPLIVRNALGGYGYAATDLAGIRYSVQELGADRLVYVTDARQAQHFAMVFAVAAQAGWLDGATAEHASFGAILGPDNRPFRTRAGDTVRLADLLDEAVLRAHAVVTEKNPALGPEEARRVAEAVGIGSVKYNDLVNDRVKDYVFDWERMLARDGNTAPYLQYAHARIRSIFRRAEEEGLVSAYAGTGEGEATVTLTAPEERALALNLLSFDSAVSAAASSLQPHRLCTYLFELASSFTSFYEACPVLREEPAVRSSRLVLCQLTAAVLARGLDLLGIEAPERM